MFTIPVGFFLPAAPPSWPDVDGYIYKEGLYADNWVEGYSLNGDNAHVDKEAGNLHIHAEDYANVSERTYVTNATINLTNYTTLTIDWENVGTYGTNNISAICVSTNKTESYATYNARTTKIRTFARVDSTIDVTTLNGSYYIRVHARDAATGITFLAVINAFNIRLT